MFPTFTGSSRKPRQVNLSGRRNAQQAKVIPGLSTQSHQHSSSLLSAQQQRARREAERRELEAARKIQCVWRGKKDLAVRRALWRKEWDEKYGREFANRKAHDLKEAISATKLFLGFYDRTWSSGKGLKRTGPPQPADDLPRLATLVHALTTDESLISPFLSIEQAESQNLYTLHRLLAILLQTISQLKPADAQSISLLRVILQFIFQLSSLALTVVTNSNYSVTVAPTYYEALSYITVSFDPWKNSDLRKVLYRCLLSPFSAPVPANLSRVVPTIASLYKAFVRFYLTSPNLRDFLGSTDFDKLAASLSLGKLSEAVLDYVEENNKTPNHRTEKIQHLKKSKQAGQRERIQEDGRLWLLAYIIYFFRSAGGNAFDNSKDGNSYIRCLTILLGDTAGEVGSRLDIEDYEMGGSGTGHDLTTITDNSTAGEDIEEELINEAEDDNLGCREKLPLPSFIREQLNTLVEQSSVSSLLSSSPSFTSAEPSGLGAEGGVQAQLLASYALTLLLVFPRKRQEIRMWLYLADTCDGVPAVRYLWEAVKKARLYLDVCEDVRAAVESLKRKRKGQANHDVYRKKPGNESSSIQRSYQHYQGALISKHDSIGATEENDDNDWRVILLFLELYSFLLIVMDDEEFFNAGKNARNNIWQTGGEGSRARDSAPPLGDVKQLTVFLKNLAFAMYWYCEEIMKEDKMRNFGGDMLPAVTSAVNPIRAGELEVAGVRGMGFNFVKGVVTGLLRMIYLRDSRRRFLPQDHWLMTSRFDMEGFIPAVVAEEESRHKLEAEGETNHLDEEQDIPRGSRFENMRRQLHKQQRNHYLAAVAPRLEILQHLPFFIPFATRVQIFREFVTVDQRRRRGGHTDPDAWRAMVAQRPLTRGESRSMLSKHHARIRRDYVFEDAFSEFYQLGEGLKEPIQISFVDKFGAEEAGIDGGGVTKEFLTSVTKEAFAPLKYNLFLENKHHMLYPNPTSIDELRENAREAKYASVEIEVKVTNLLKQYEFLGRIIGKCLYEGILVDINFTGVFLLQWSYGKDGGGAVGNGYRPGVNDLRDLDEELYQGLVTLKNYTGDVETDFALNFTVTSSLSLDRGRTKTITVDLKPNGSNIPVTNATRLEYIHLVSKYRLLIQPRLQINAFLQGLGSIIKPSWLSMFNQSELQTLVGGGDSPIDVADLRKNTIYGGLYVIGDDGIEHPVIQNFWKVMEKDLTDEERRKVLKFVTSVSRAPLLGFGTLNPRFSIRDSGDDQERLPSTSTCVNLLKLPRYKDRETLRRKLLYAVNAGAGFDL
ncbi:hypothetical protein BDZ91DRAFT_722879, partial [Kalaharituber pfeilii]